jgi:hypothetical protein
MLQLNQRGTVVATTLATYSQISHRMSVWLRSTAAQPRVAMEAKVYLERIEKIKTVDEFLKDDRTLRFAMKAFGLEDMAYAKGFIRKVLNEGVDSSNAFANKLADSRYRDFAATFNFLRYGETTTIFDRTRQGTVDKYVQQVLEESAGTQNENVRLAIYFQRKAPTITSPYQILADRALTQVVYQALALSPSTSLMNIDAQARLITSRLNVADFGSPDKLSRFIARFAGMADLASATSSGSTASLLSGGAAAAGLGTDLLLAVQAARHGSLR